MKFLEERVFNKVKSLFDSVPKNKRLNFANERKETSASGKDKATTGIMERVVLAAIIETLEKSGLVNLSEISQYRKSKLIQKLNLVYDDPRVYVAIIDMEMIWPMSAPTREDRKKADAKVFTLGGILSPRLSISPFLNIASHENHDGERSLQFAVFHKG